MITRSAPLLQDRSALSCTTGSVDAKHFRLPASAKIAALHDAGIVLMATATSLEEGGRIAAAGIDAIIAQGIAACSIRRPPTNGMERWQLSDCW